MTTQFVRFTKNVRSIVLAYFLSVAAFGYAYHSDHERLRDSEKTTIELRKQNDAIELQNRAIADQAQRQRNGLCGFQQYLAVPTSTPPNPANVSFRELMAKLTGPDSLNCTPDPNDGK